MTFLVGFVIDFVESVIKLLVIMNPVGAIPFFQGLTAQGTLEQKRMIARKSSLVTLSVLLIFAYLGNAILYVLQIDLNYVMIAGGAFILVFAVKDAISGSSQTHSSASESQNGAGTMPHTVADHVAVFPIAVPLLAGPGAVATVMILNNPQYGAAQGILDLSTGLAIIVDCVIVWMLLALSNKLIRIVKPSAMIVTSKLMDILMGAIGVSFLIRGAIAIFGMQAS